jgi:hypothetical protein
MEVHKYCSLGEWNVRPIFYNTGNNKGIPFRYDIMVAGRCIGQTMDLRDHPLSHEENKANGLLMAAAKDLYEALALAREIIERISSDYAAITNKHADYTVGEARVIDHAIQKAKGE